MMFDFQRFAGLPMRDLFRLFSRVHVAEGDDDTTDDTKCWPWTGAVNRDGYGETRIAGRKISVHRAVFQIFAAESVPSGVVVRHRCDNPRCCNPSHLESGTVADNVADRVARKRSATGSRNGRSKLTDGQARAIFTDPRSSAVVAAEYGVNSSVVRQIKAGIKWKDATRDLRAT